MGCEGGGGGDVGVVVGMGVCIAYIQLRMILYSRQPMEDKAHNPQSMFCGAAPCTWKNGHSTGPKGARLAENLWV